MVLNHVIREDYQVFFYVSSENLNKKFESCKWIVKNLRDN